VNCFSKVSVEKRERWFSLGREAERPRWAWSVR
jgi:hypothetical protein